MTRTTAAVALLAALAVALPTRAQDPPQRPEDFIKRLDKNGDGVLTRDELPPRLADAFDRFDTNKDGKLDRGEVAVMLRTLGRQQPGRPGRPEQLVERLLEQFDTNKDGKIDKKEARGILAENFDRIDTN